ncbi:MAG: transposase [Gemmatimonadaceae bacterium]|nr:transposase [Gemmatimonadaceae bacterium]
MPILVQASVKKAGRPPIFGEADVAFLLARVTDDPHLTTRALAVEMSTRLGREVSWKTVATTLQRMGIAKVKPRVAAPVASSAPYGYRPHHRRKGTATSYPSHVTDAEWELVRDLFEHQGPGRPEQHTRRSIFDAISYVVRSGCPWRMLPKDFPKWQLVYATFRAWSADDRFERMNDRLREQWRIREGRAAEPTASVLDSQSVRTAEKGGSAAMMRARGSRGASGTF